MDVRELNIKPPSLFSGGFNPMKTDLMFAPNKSGLFDN